MLAWVGVDCNGIRLKQQAFCWDALAAIPAVEQGRGYKMFQVFEDRWSPRVDELVVWAQQQDFDGFAASASCILSCKYVGVLLNFIV